MVKKYNIYPERADAHYTALTDISVHHVMTSTAVKNMLFSLLTIYITARHLLVVKVKLYRHACWEESEHGRCLDWQHKSQGLSPSRGGLWMPLVNTVLFSQESSFQGYNPWKQFSSLCTWWMTDKQTDKIVCIVFRPGTPWWIETE